VGSRIEDTHNMGPTVLAESRLGGRSANWPGPNNQANSAGVGAAAAVLQEGSCKYVKVRRTSVPESLALTLCGSTTGWMGGMMCSSHGASLGGDAMVSKSVRALGRVSTSRKQGRIRPTRRRREPSGGEVLYRNDISQCPRSKGKLCVLTAVV
jgi:hypothetical protein